MFGKHELPIRLYREHLNVPWGFRLQGGVEFNSPLTVQRVFVGSISEGQLHRGDIILAIDNHDVRKVSHHSAQELIKKAGRDLMLRVARGNKVEKEYYTNEPSHSYHHNQLHNSQVEDHKKFRDIKKMFSSSHQPSNNTHRIHLDAQPGMTSYTPKRPHITSHSHAPDFGWTPGSQPHQQPAQFNRYQPSYIHQVPVNRHPQNESAMCAPPRHINVYHEAPEPPAWVGTLRSSGGPKFWEIQEAEALAGRGEGARPPGNLHNAVSSKVMGEIPSYDSRQASAAVHSPRVQAVRYSPGGTQIFHQEDAEQSHSDTARVAHLQYNTPLGLYSGDNAREVLDAQTRGKAGQGTMEIRGGGGDRQFDPAQSSVFRLLQEEEAAKKRGGMAYHRACPNPGAATAMRAAASVQMAPPKAASHGRSHGGPHGEEHGSHGSHRFQQLVHENDDQAISYAATQHPHGGFEDLTISDF